MADTVELQDGSFVTRVWNGRGHYRFEVCGRVVHPRSLVAQTPVVSLQPTPAEIQALEVMALGRTHDRKDGGRR